MSIGYGAHMKTIGLTGGIGSGKTTVARMLAELGAVVINADQVGHEVYAPKTPGWECVTAAFGEQILDDYGCIDRKKLGALVFADPRELARLNAIVHPLIFDAIRHRIEVLRDAGEAALVIVEAAVLLEANWQQLVDEVWVVTADRQTVTDRLAADRGLSPTQVASRIDAQTNDAERRKAADVIIENTGSMDQLRARVAAAWKQATAHRSA